MFIGSGPRLPDGKAAPSGVHGGQRTFSPQAAHRPISAALSVGQLGEYRLDVQDFSLRVLWAKRETFKERDLYTHKQRPLRRPTRPYAALRDPTRPSTVGEGQKRSCLSQLQVILAGWRWW